MTAESLDKNISFVSRVFAPIDGILEDQVCGSAHCLLAPYWSVKLGKIGDTLTVKQVSQRGGDLKVRWLEEEGLVVLGGKTRTIMMGTLLLYSIHFLILCAFYFRSCL